jgi:hypothetical protein
MAGHDHTPDLHEHTDDWHHHSKVEGAPQIEHASVANPNVLVHWLIGIIISMLVVIAALGMYFARYYSLTRQDKIETLDFYNGPGGAHDQLVKAEGSLGTDKTQGQYTYHAANAQSHTVQIPIEQAMQRVVAKYQSSKTAQAPATTPTPTKN